MKNGTTAEERMADIKTQLPNPGTSQLSALELGIKVFVEGDPTEEQKRPKSVFLTAWRKWRRICANNEQEISL